jgi:hypothetical protein
MFISFSFLSLPDEKCLPQTPGKKQGKRGMDSRFRGNDQKESRPNHQATSNENEQRGKEFI